LASSLKGVISQQLLKSADGKGRHAAHEIMLYSDALPGIIRGGDTVKLTSLIQTGANVGMISMDSCLMNLVKDGKVTKEQASLKAMDKSKFK
jgi:twitching motility protein PilT